MIRSTHFPKGRGSILAILALTALCIQGYAQSVITPAGNVPLTAQQEHYLREQLNDGIASAWEIVEVHTPAIKSGGPVTLGIFGKSHPVQHLYTEERSPGDYSWVGRSDNGYGSVLMVVNGDMVTGRFTLDFAVYSLMPLGEGLHVLMALDASAFPKDENEDLYREKLKTAKAPVLDHTDYDDNPDEAGQPKAFNSCSIRYLIAYTTAVNSALADVHGFIQSCIDSHNLVNNQSQGDHRVELARSVRVTYTEVGGDFGTDLERFKATSDGFMDNIHSLRTLYDADVCQLIVNPGDGCGLAYNIGSTYSTAFAVTKRSCAVGNLTFTHETGHLYGARHDPFVDASVLPIPWAHGYVKTSGTASSRWRTVMAYNDHCASLGADCPRLDYWSNPNITYNGSAMGTAALHYNALVVSSEESVLADYEARITNKSVTNTTIPNNEWGNIEGITSLTAPGITSTSVEYQSGSKGNYRAGNEIILREGFWARSGTDFVAYLGSCANPQYIVPMDDYVISAEETPDELNGNTAGTTLPFGESDATAHTVQIFPNPFTSHTYIEVESPAGSNLLITVYDMLGSVVAQPYSGAAPDSGKLRVEAQLGDLPSGVYIVNVKINETPSVHRIVKNR